MSDKTFSQVLNFTRPDPGTYYDSAGVLQTAAVDEPRFTHDPATLGPLGLLIEEQRTNLFLRSEAFDNAYWTKSNVTITPDEIEAPDGALTADLATNAASGNKRISRNFSATIGQEYTTTVFVKVFDTTLFSISIFDSTLSSEIAANYDLSAVSTTSSGASIESVSNGWLKLTFTFEAFDSSQNIFYRIGGGVGLDSASIYIWGAQLEVGSFPTSYIKTEGSQVTRSADNCSRTLGSEFNSEEWTLYSEGKITVDNSSFGGPCASITDGSTANRITAFYSGNSGAGLFRLLSVVGGNPFFEETNDTGIRSGDSVKLAISRTGDTYTLYINGSERAVHTRSLNNTILNSLPISDADGSTLSATTKGTRLYPRALSATELQELTA